jgi:hypothetical protein
LKAHANDLEARIGIRQWFRFYNDSRQLPSFGLQDPGGSNSRTWFKSDQEKERLSP